MKICFILIHDENIHYENIVIMNNNRKTNKNLISQEYNRNQIGKYIVNNKIKRHD